MKIFETMTINEYVSLMFNDNTTNKQKKTMVTKTIKNLEANLKDMEEQIQRQNNPLFFWRFGEQLHSGRTIKAAKK